MSNDPTPQHHPLHNLKGQAGANRPRTPAEWTTLALSLAIVAAVASLLAYEGLTSDNRPASFEITPHLADVRHDRGLYYLPISVRNTGDHTAEKIRISVHLADPGADSNADRAAPPGTAAAHPPVQLQIEFLAGGESFEAAVIFDRDPTQSRVHAHVTGYHKP